MASIPLPALDVRPPAQPPNALDEYGKMLALKGQMAMQPLQQQEAQQQVQSGQIDLQMKQQQQKDQKALSATMQQWGQAPTGSGPKAGIIPAPSAQGQGSSVQGLAPGKSAFPSYDDLVPLAIKNGASFQAVQGLQAHVLDMKNKASEIAKNDAQTGSSNAEAMKQKNGMIIDALTGVTSLPDAQLAQGITQTAQELAAKQLLDPQHVQMAQKIAGQAQSGDVAGARQQLDLYTKSLGGYSKLLDDAQKAHAVAAEQATEAWDKQHGMTPGVNPEQMSLADWLQKNPGKGASDYQIAMKKIVPAYNFNLAQAGAAGAGGGAGGAPVNWGAVSQRYGMTPGAFDQSAEKYFQTGQLPPIGRNANAIAMNRDLMNRAAELHPNASLAANSAEFKANSDSLKKLQTNFDQVQAFEATATKNMDLLQQTAAKIPDLGARFANIPVRSINASMLGTDDMARFNTALNTAQTEAAKVLNSSNATGVLSDSARHELQTIIDGNVPYSALVASLNTLKQDMGNRTQAYQQQIADIKTRLGGGGAAQPSAAQPGAQPADSSFSQFGGVKH